MKTEQIQTTGTPATLRDVLDRLSDDDIVDSRKRDLRSAVASFAKLVDKVPGLIPLDLAAIRRTLDGAVPAQAGVSAKRWANLRSDLSAAIAASGLRPMLKTAKLDLAEPWKKVLNAVQDPRIRHGSRGSPAGPVCTESRRHKWTIPRSSDLSPNCGHARLCVRSTISSEA